VGEEAARRLFPAEGADYPLENLCNSSSRPSPPSHCPYLAGLCVTVPNGHGRHRYFIVTAVVMKETA
jgi:hypothetical protein